MESLKIIALCTLVAVAYGIVHDQITARICIEYFTVAHPPLVNSRNPTVVALAWGVVATWWVGAGAGIALALASRVGPLPKLTARDQVKPLLVSVLATAAFATIIGLLGYALSASGAFRIGYPIMDRIPRDHHVGFYTAGFIHNGSYLGAFIASVVVFVITLRRRAKRTAANKLQRSHGMSAAARVQAFFDAFLKGDIDAVVAMMDEKMTFEIPTCLKDIPIDRRMEGRDAIRKFFVEVRPKAVEYHKFEVFETLEAGERVVMLGRTEGRALTTGKPFAFNWIQVYRVVNDKIVEGAEYFDPYALSVAFE